MAARPLRCLAMAIREDVGDLASYDGPSHKAHKRLKDPSTFVELEQVREMRSSHTISRNLSRELAQPRARPRRFWSAARAPASGRRPSALRLLKRLSPTSLARACRTSTCCFTLSVSVDFFSQHISDANLLPYTAMDLFKASAMRCDAVIEGDSTQT